ncbi:MAG: glycosyltransferase family 1 protein [Glaciihabitans sp.]|nr:glycosyltransferase family 1 protein [Glaciihabitans sp.]
MKIIFDCRYVRVDHHDGISRFSAKLVESLARIHPLTMLISDERQLAVLPDMPWVMATPPTSAAEPFVSRRINRFAPDIVYTPMQTLGPGGRRFALVTTVHDLIYYTNRTPPRDLAWPVRLLWRLYHLAWWPQRMLLRSADAHVAVSETTRRIMLEHRLTKHPITVVSNAVDAPASVRSTSTGSRDLVYMGSFMPYKNVELLARGLHELPGYTLHLMSRASDSDIARLEALAPAGSLKFHGGVSDEEYFSLLATADALVSASRDEGFGIPLVESMAGGTPVVVSDIPIFREIGGDAAVYFDVDAPSSFAAAVKSLEDPAEWTRRSLLSHERSLAYDWNRSAETLLAVLQRTVAARTAR